MLSDETDYNPSSMLVTGGAGFIGSSFINFFRKQYVGVRLINLDKLMYCSSLVGVEHDHFEHCDLSKDWKSILNILQAHNIDTVIHFAAQSHVDNSFGNSLSFTQDNIVGTHNLLESCRVYGQVRRFIHISTDEVYGEIEATEESNEASLLNPTNPYAASKAGAEFLVRSYFYSFSLPVIIIRGNNVYGPRQFPEKVIPKFILQLLTNRLCTIQGKGQSRRNFIYVDDVCNAIQIVLRKGHLNNIYNIGSANEYSVLDIASVLLKNIHGSEQLENWIRYIPDRNFNDQRYAISSQKIRQLGWREEVPFTEGLQRTIQWYKDHLKIQPAGEKNEEEVVDFWRQRVDWKTIH